MDSGAYRVQNSLCSVCDAFVGWKFVCASEISEKWKEGFFILELNLLQEEVPPLSPLEEVDIEYHFHRLSDLGHRRSASDISRPRPMGPRHHKPE